MNTIAKNITTNSSSILTVFVLSLLIATPLSADIFDDIVNIQIDDLGAGTEAVAAAEGVAPLEFDLELEHSGAAGFDVDISAATGCDFFVRITHFAPTMGAPIGPYEWIISDIHMRDSNGSEMFAKITSIEIPSPFDNLMPTTGIHFTDWVVAFETGPFPSSSVGASNDYLVRVAVIGDINKDCEINLLDIDPFVDLLSNNDFAVEADINQDGLLNLLDVQEFVGLLSE